MRIPVSEKLLVATVVLSSVQVGHVLAAVINVPADQPTIQAGINAAANGDTVLVAPGTYNEAILITGKSITVASSDGPKATVIDGSGPTSTVTIQGGLTNGSVLRGFLITGGNGTQVADETRGGGIYILNAATTIKECEIVDNSVFAPILPGQGYGGGVYAAAAGTLVMLDCLIANNHASAGIAGGGGVYVAAGSAVFRRCVFHANVSHGAFFMGMPGSSSGRMTSSFSASFINCAFIENQTTGASGG